MLIVGENLRALCTQFKIIDDSALEEGCYDVNSLTLRLHEVVKHLVVPTAATVVYGNELNAEWIREETLGPDGLVLTRRAAVLACSREHVFIPPGYFGFIQTKGSLARLFISVACNDGQIEAGFKGRITFEITNSGPMRVKLNRGDPIAQLFILRASTNNLPLYNGRYQNAQGPTVFVRHRSPATTLQVL